ncbi:MAG TPA: GxxExxY protein [Acetobacteraceae bacterium]|jgi:GxxExxY protein
MHAKHADKLNELSGIVTGCAFTALNTLAAGLLEKGNENALAHELRKAGLVISQQRGAIATYDGTVIADYFVDLLAEDAVLAELKTVNALDEAHRLQCVNYLKATGRQLCRLLNFRNPRLEIKRVVNRL